MDSEGLTVAVNHWWKPASAAVLESVVARGNSEAFEQFTSHGGLVTLAASTGGTGGGFRAVRPLCIHHCHVL